MPNSLRMGQDMSQADTDKFNAHWETDIYARGRQINRYPFPVFIGPVMSMFGGAPDRGRVEVLEIGCGAGNNIWFFAREGFSIHGIDGSESALAHARRRLAAEGLTADLRRGDFQNLPFDDESMDFVLDRAAMTHNTRPVVEATIAEVSRVLKPGGVFFSQIFTTDHSDIKFARDYADNSASDFTDGYFAGIGRTFFADRSDLDRLFGAKFAIRSIEREVLEDMLNAHISAVWNVLMQKAATT
jgi:SAM-dependent methyltransferase